MNAEQLKMIMEMGADDVGGMEDEQTRLLKLAEGLRGNINPVRGKDVGGNVGNAGFGIASALSNYQAGKMAPDITTGRKASFKRIIDGLAKKPQFPVGNNPDEDPSLYGGY